MRAAVILLAAAVCLLAFSSFASAQTAEKVYTPTTWDSPTAESQCMLDKLEFTNGLVLTERFNPKKFRYTCSCSNYGRVFSTQVKPHLMDDYSSAEITFNNVPINFRTTANALSNGGNDGKAPNSPRTISDVLNFVTGLNTIKIGVGCNGLGAPNPCYYEYVITCEKPDDGSYVVGDPQFVGLRGQQYQVHGVSGEIYNIISDADLQYNSRFVFLNQGECPIVNGKKQKGCFSHPGSYLGELGLKTAAGDRIHLTTGSAKDGFAAVEVNGKAIEMGDTVVLANNMGSVSRNSTHLASVQVGNWDFAFENSDMFVNQRVRVLDTRSLRSHGLLGQTWREKTYPNAVKHIAGKVDDYVIRDGDIFGDDFVFNSHN